jgi:RNA polymerase sigma-70 factor (ECF subfamily)
MEETLEAWFIREILAHEEALVRYLSRHWPKQDEILDLRQETYIRVYETAHVSRPLTPRAFLFTTARNLLVDRIRRKRIVSIDAVGDLESLNVLVDEISPEHRLDARQELRRLTQAFDDLPPRCREAVWMRRVDELPQKEIATRLGITEKVVEKHITLGMRRLVDAMFGSKPGDTRESARRTVDKEKKGHGKP